MRGFGLGTAGLVVAVASAAAAHRGDRGRARSSTGSARGPRSAAGLVLQAVGFGLLPLVRHPWQAFVLMAVEGAGCGRVLAEPVDADRAAHAAARRHAAFAQQRLTMNLGVGARRDRRRVDRARRAARARSRVLFLLDAVTFLGYVGVLGFIHDPGAGADETRARAPTAPCSATGRSSGSGR